MDENKIPIQEEFFKACVNKDLKIVENLISTGHIDINATDQGGDTPLHIAIFIKSQKLLQLLLENKANVHSVNSRGVTPLFRAIIMAKSEMAGSLISHGAGLINICGNGKSALGLALGTKLADAEEINHEFDQHCDIVHGSSEYDLIIDMILQRGMNSEDETEVHYFSLCHAIVKNDLETAKSLVKQVEDIDFESIKAESPLFIAVRLSRLEITELLLQNGSNPNQNPSAKRDSVLFVAMDSKCLEMIKLLLKFNTKVNITSLPFVCHSDFWWTPLCIAAQFTDQKYTIDLMTILLQNGASVNGTSTCSSVTGITALDAVCSKGFLGAVELLVRHSANINIRDSEKNTPLHRSVKYPDVVKFLLEKGAEVGAKNFRGETPLHLACKLLDQNESIKILLQHGARLDCRTKRGRTVLHYAAVESQIENFKYVADCAIRGGLLSVNAKDKNGYSPLHETRIFVNECDIFVEILKKGADLNSKTKKGFYTPHHHNFEYNMQCPVIEYVVRLQALGYTVENDMFFFQKISSSKGTEGLYLVYQNEIQELKSQVIAWNPKTTIYDMLFMRRSLLARFSVNGNLIDAFKSCRDDFESQYPYFGSLLNVQLQRGCSRRNFMNSVLECLEETFGNFVPDVCHHLICKFLNDSQLKMFLSTNNKLV